MAKKTALHKLIWREITSSKARFLSILTLILLGVGFFSGLQATGPNMLKTANQYFTEQQLYDMHVQSNYGIDEEELALFEADEAVDRYEAGYSKDVLFGVDRLVVKLISYAEDNHINQYEVNEGRLPEAADEIALDHNDVLTHRYQLGDEVSIYSGQSSEDLSESVAESTFTVVGFVTSPRYITNDSRGQTTIGRGQIDAFAVVNEDAFQMEVYTDLFVTFDRLADLSMYGETYKDLSLSYKEDYEPQLIAAGSGRIDEIREEGQRELEDARAEIEAAEQELLDAEQELVEAEAELEDGRGELEAGQQELEDAYVELDQAEQDYRAGVQAFEEEIADARAELDQQAARLSENETAVRDGIAEVEAGLRELQEPYITLVEQETALLDERDALRSLDQQLRELYEVPEDLITEQMRQDWINETSSVVYNEVALSDLLTGYFADEVTEAEINTFISGAETGLNEALSEIRTNLEAVTEQRNELMNQQDQLEGNLAEIEAGKQEIENGREQLDRQVAQTERELEEARTELDQGWYEYDQAVAELEEAEADIEQGEIDYEEGLATFNEERAEAEEEISDARTEIADAEEELRTLEAPTYYVNVRHDNGQLVEYEDNAERMSDLATIFPVVFFLIAALVTLTTVTRMIEEQRVEMGTLKALGYSDRDIQKKYYLYALSASMIGALLGLVLGYTLLPKVIFNAYKILYDLPPLALGFYWSFALISIGIALFSSLITAWYVLRQDLKSNPAVLMRPKAPKSGKRILVERLTPLWRRMNFMQKVTARNLFRYKQRMLMTVIGISGCAALIITGFGLKGAVEGIVDLQFGKVMQYEAVVALDNEADESSKSAYRSIINDEEAIESALSVYQEALEVSETGTTTQNVTLFVPENPERLPDFVQLENRLSSESYQLDEEGAIVTEKLATLFDIEPGDELTFTDPDNVEYQVEVGAIIENYAGHYLYMSPDVYQETMASGSIGYNAELLTYTYDADFEQALADTLSDQDYVVTVSFNQSMLNLFEDSMESLNIVVIVLIVAAAGLAFIVLYNLTNINVSERIRELSTIKVLGFYDNEVTMYIYRENIILTLMGIVVGALFGRLLHIFVLDTASMDNMMFNPSLHWSSYLYAAVLTLVFSTLVMWLMHRKLKGVDMIEALKSNE